MKRRVGLAILLLVALATVYLVSAQVLYLTHKAAVIAALGELLERFDGQLPQSSVELTMLDHSDPEVQLHDVASWQVETVELTNSLPAWRALLDDDPTYRLQAGLQVRYEDGSEARLAWESWRYGVVVGPVVISQGDGPPGWLTVASIP